MLRRIREVVHQNEHRRNILSQIGDIEQRLLEATKRSRQLSLQRYFDSLQHMRYEEYSHKDTETPDCTICLINFQPSEEIIVFSCDCKHYFHDKCGREWLEVKTECPLCRFDFSDDI